MHLLLGWNYNSKITMFAHFQEYNRNREKIKSLYGFGGCCHKITDVCMDL